MPRAKLNPRSSTRGKLSAPHHARVFARDRLFAQLDAIADRPIAWIAGPPGSGKTTLAASYLASRKRTLLWALLDRADSDPATFFHFVTLAAAAARPRQRMRLPAITNEDRRDIGSFAQRYFRVLAGYLDPPWVLVLDNYQELDEDSTIHEAIRALVPDLAAGAQIIAISRALPPQPLIRAVASQELGLIDAQALRFTIDETRSLLDLHGRVEAAQHLFEATGGWAAGLILMLASDATVSAVPTPGGASSQQFVFEYFAGEVFSRMEPEQRDILMRVALLPSVSEGMAIAISAAPAAGRTLAELYRRNLFVDRRGTTDPIYVFHALFRDFLLARAGEALAPEEMRALKRLAARLLAEHGQIDAAMLHLIEAAAWDEAETLLHGHAPSYVEQERTQPLREWIDAFPAAYRERPMNLYWRAYVDLAQDPAATLARFDRAFEGFAAAGDPTGQLLAASGAAEAIVLQGTGQEGLDRWIRVFEALAPQYFELRNPAIELRVLPGMLAAFVAREAHHRLTAILVDRAEQLLDHEPAANQRILFGAVANCFNDIGQHERLGRIVARIDRLRDAPHIAPVTAFRWRQIEVVWKTLVGRLEEAIADADDALRLAELPGMERFRGTAHVSAAGAAWGNVDVARARWHLERARSLVSPARKMEKRNLEFFSGVVAIQAGEPEIAVRHLRIAVDLSRDAGSPGLERVAQFNLCVAATEAGDFVGAEEALRSARSHPSYDVSPFHQWVITTIEANLASRKCERERCVAALARAFTIARENGYTYAPGIFANGIMPRMCARALEHGIEVALARQFIRQQALIAPDGATADWPWPIRVRTLGRFHIERDDAPLPLTRKEQKKPLELLRLLIASGCTSVNVKQLAQVLWPEVEGDAARNSFDNALHRLRKLLGGDRTIMLQDGGLTLDRGTCWVDTLVLDECFSQAELLLRSPYNEANVDEIARRMLALYRGPFLDGDESYPPIIATRDRLRARFLRQLSAIALLHEEHERFEKAGEIYRRILEQDVLAEDIYRRVIRCYLKQGLRAEAFEAYRRCRDNLSIILGIRPSVETEALAAELRAP